MKIKFKELKIKLLIIFLFSISIKKNHSFGTDLLIARGDEDIFIYDKINLEMYTNEAFELTGSGGFDYTTQNFGSKTKTTIILETSEVSTELVTGSGSFETDYLSTTSTSGSTNTVEITGTTPIVSTGQDSTSTETSSTLTSSFGFISSSTNVAPINTPCLFNDDCKIEGSICYYGDCSCPIDTVIFNNKCTPFIPVFVVLPVFVAFNDLCDIFDGLSSNFIDSFTDVINSNSYSIPQFTNQFIKSSVSQLYYTGKIESSYLNNQCPPSVVRNLILQNRFDYSLSSTNDSSLKYQNLINNCSNFNNSNFSIEDCFFRFDVEFSLLFSNNFSNNSGDQNQLTKNYTNLLIDNLKHSLTDALIFFQLNSNNNSLYLAINKKADFCQIEADCLNGSSLNEKIEIYLNQLKNDIQNYTEINIPENREICNFFKDDCTFDHRKCVISLLKTKKCVCQNRYFDFKSDNDDCVDCSKNCQNNGICFSKNDIEYCYCSSFFFGDICEINGLIIFVIGIVILILSFIACILLWFCFIVRKKKEAKVEDVAINQGDHIEETQIHQVDNSEDFDKDNFFENLQKPTNWDDEFNAEWDKFTADDEVNWDIIFGKNEDLNTIENAEETGAINPAFLTKSNLMIPRINLNGNKDLFGTDLSSTIKSQISLPGPINFDDFKGIPRAWLAGPNIEDYESDHSEVYF